MTKRLSDQWRQTARMYDGEAGAAGSAARRKDAVAGATVLRLCAEEYDREHPAEPPPVTLATFCAFLEHAIPEEDPEYRVEVTPLTGVELHDAAMNLNRMATRPGGHEPVAAVSVRRGGKTFLGVWREVE